MRILVDADSCPKRVRKLVVRAGKRLAIETIFAANRPMPGVEGPFAVMEECPPEIDAADDRLVELARRGDVAITKDIPLAARLVQMGVLVLDDRGVVFTREKIQERRCLRSLMTSQVAISMPPRPASYGKKELKAFADNLDRILTRLVREETGG